MTKPKVAFYWCASCGGCEEAVVDLNETLLKVADAVDIVLWPVALDFKKKHIEAMKDGEITVSFINGAVRLGEQEEWAKLLRQKSQLVVAFGACACIGGIPGLANLYSRKDILDRAYEETPSTVNPEKTRPQKKTGVEEGSLLLPEFFENVKPMDAVIPVDYYLPGCPPPPDLVAGAVTAILTGTLPPKGSVLAPSKSLCDVCPRKETKPEKLAMREIKRPYQVKMDPTKCFLAQSIICLGPATRSGCGETCIKGNQPCRGCFGPVAGVKDQGAKSVSMLASILGIDNEDQMSDKDVEKLINQVPDPVGTFYRFTLASSPLRRKKIGVKAKKAREA